MAAGLNPVTDFEVNNTIGTLLREFTTLREEVLRNQNWLRRRIQGRAVQHVEEDETNIKSAVAG
jgi:hypothetical protein